VSGAFLAPSLAGFIDFFIFFIGVWEVI